MMAWAPVVFSVVGSLFGIIATALMGMVLSKVSGLEHNLEKQSDQLLAHITSSNLHEAGLVELREQVKQVLAIAKVAHERADKLELAVLAKEGRAL